jgi:hypothetical protein
MTTVLDGAGEGSAKACWVLMRGARADMFGCASHRKIKTSVLAVAKTGQVLVRTSRHSSVPKVESIQSQKLAMSGGLNLPVAQAFKL